MTVYRHLQANYVFIRISGQREATVHISHIVKTATQCLSHFICMCVDSTYI